MKKTTLRNITIIGAVAAFSIPLIAVGSYHFAQQKDTIHEILKKNEDDNKNNILDGFIGVKVRNENNPNNFFPSQAISEENKINFRSYLSYSISPETNLQKILEKRDVTVEPIENTANDYYGTLGIRIKGFQKGTQTLLETREFIASGFKSTSVGDIRFKNRTKNNFDILQFTKKANLDQIELNKLNSENFFSYFNPSENFEFKDNKVLLKENENYELKVDVDTKNYNKQDNSLTIFARLSHSAYPDFYVSKKFELKNLDFKNSANIQQNPLYSANIKLEVDNAYKTIFPSSLATSTQQNLKTIFRVSGLEADDYQIEIIKESLDDQTGNIDIKLIDKDKNTRIFSFKLFSFDDISENIYTLTHINKEYIEKAFNVQTNKEEVVKPLNSDSDSTLRYKSIGKELSAYLNTSSFWNHIYASNQQNINNYQYYDLKNFKIIDNKLTFVLHTWSGQEFNLYIKFSQEASDTNNITLDAPRKDGSNELAASKTSQEILEDIKKRTLSIQYSYYVDKDSVRIISGTAWIFDRELDENGKGTNTYYIATNMHVVSDLINNYDKVNSFAYTYSNKYDQLPSIQSRTADGTSYNEVFRRFDRPIKTADPFSNVNNSRYITKESIEFWKNLEVIPLGLDSPSKDKILDFALIKVTFPDDKIVQTNPFFSFFSPQTKKIQNIPDQVNYYNEHKLDFFISDKIKFPKNESDPLNYMPLPTELHLGGYLGGDTWVEVSRTPYVGYKKLTKDGAYNNKIYKPIDTLINLPNIRSGKGMSGSLVLNQYGQVFGIFWGGFFDDDFDKQGLSTGTGIVDPISVKLGEGTTSLLRKWLDETKDKKTDLDAFENKIKF
ncbi:DUF31 family putative serine protease [Mycoplasma procyoni]|uniref:DUF31 family putative serine protease n=1 Tax=Mycoplasma procyoni TaxID=568784 RepID=UPI00197BA8C0|nr:hypothetical protein [Mycoplasma procyoni]MBN3534449.1 hypothetical protein [Mycoplasma procyoni]